MKSGGRRQLYKAIGAGLVLATWLLGAIWLDRKVSLRGEQQSADAYLFATTLTRSALPQRSPMPLIVPWTWIAP